MAESTWVLHISYLAERTITRVRLLPTERLVGGGSPQTVPPQAGDHLLSPFADRATAERVRTAVTGEIAFGGRWRPGALPRLQRGLGIGVETWHGDAPLGQDASLG